MGWIYHNPSFEYDNYQLPIKMISAWGGHRDFAYDLVRFMQPKLVVELGTQYGVSFFSFCQAVKDGGLSTSCHAIDTWEGDPHSGLYDKNVFNVVKKIADKYYPNIAKLVPSKFDDAVDSYQDQTIDILHIDGYHTFEAVSHDYETWLPKVSTNGIVLFHDIAVQSGGFGVYKLWNTLKEQYPAIQFEHSYGLGVLFPKGYSEAFEEVIQKAGDISKTYKQ
ncbi:class I SAM-dependent methyltransferase [Priestia endophytica]|uniref:class I SAM-dependent methyltransferase n=1 Tax=Priestia endophytica TaxID=135735 RepID=UPI00124BCF5B|nr:class I SAM-dependent methyltransferase [Priestia endophytica]KAB2488081.1 class I SAM-dependent methyltransferase [Priestia endophytica]MCM3541132.1 class I SAM-dependent methyltransferase [Priestia endophytica]